MITVKCPTTKRTFTVESDADLPEGQLFERVNSIGHHTPQKANARIARQRERVYQPLPRRRVSRWLPAQSRVMVGIAGLFLALFSNIGQAQWYPEAERPIACEYLTDHFEYAYLLYADAVERELAIEIVARDPDLDMYLQWPLYVGIVVLYEFERNAAPPMAAWLPAAQLACAKLLGTDLLEPQGRQRIFYKNPRKEASYHE